MTMLKAAALCCAALAPLPAMAQQAITVEKPAVIPAHKPGPGRLVHYRDMPSRFVDARNVTVWLPDDYDPKGGPYAVIYMHDGQNVLETATAMGGEEWGMDEMLTKLTSEHAIRPAIVVAIATPKGRSREYMPRKVFDGLPAETRQRLTAEQGGTPLSDRYLRFIVEELKPFIDRSYRTAPDRKNTFIIGASMGGLISLYAAAEYPQVFGGAGCLSTHWPLFVMPEAYQTGRLDTEAVTTAFERYLRKTLARGPKPRIWFDHGTETLDSNYARYQERIDALLPRIGWAPGRDFMSKTFPGTNHSERSWRERLDQPLLFLLPAEKSAP